MKYKCLTCKYREKRKEGTWCKNLHYYPNTKIIKAMGCIKYEEKPKQITLFELD